jgi:non-ribosomal peptide synthetase component F
LQAEIFVKTELADKWKDTVQFYNEYGPTETTVTTIEYLASSNKDPRISNLPIGKPMQMFQYIF